MSKLTKKAIVLKQCGTDIKTDIQTNGTKQPRNKPSQLWPNDSDKGVKTIQRQKDNFFNKRCWVNWISTYKRMTLDPNLTPYIKITSNGSMI